MRLSELLKDVSPEIDAASLSNGAISSLLIQGITNDSRKVQPGDLYIIRKGNPEQTQTYAADAIGRGAIAILSRYAVENCNIVQIHHSSPDRIDSVIANRFYNNPSQSMKVIGVTGTNGKTTTTYLIRHMLNLLNKKCGMIGTVEIDDGRSTAEANMTTPDSPVVAQLLAKMKSNGCASCAIETSSHALDQHRVAGVKFAGAGFTNLTGDHLDYHKDMDQYAAAKSKLFEKLSHDAVAVINIDDPYHEKITRRCGCRIVTFGIKKRADYFAENYSVTANGTRFLLKAPDGSTEVNLRLVGRHNIENALCAIALCCEVYGFSVPQVAAAISTAIGAPGRLQTVNLGQPFSALVDYAHTDDALKNVLTALRPITRGSLRVVFGCGGDRDKTKRPRMAKIAQQLADYIYVTSDNPRTEDPQAILADIIEGFPIENTKPIIIEADRRTAIYRAIEDAQQGDVVLIAGKGHENYQIVKGTKYHFDDVEEVAEAITSSTRA